METPEELAARLKAKYAKGGSKKKYLNKTGFWVSPKGVTLPTGSKKHIDVVIENPIRFNMSKQYIQQLHTKHGEKIGQEGEARDDIMTKILEDGWIRVRARRNFISIQVWEFDRKTLSNIEKFAKEGYEKGFNSEYIAPNEVFKVSALKNGRVRQTEVEKVIGGGLNEAMEYDYYDGVLIEEKPLVSLRGFLNSKNDS